MFHAIALGELLIDFTPCGVSDAGNTIFERNPGGAPANVLAAMAKLGARTAFIGKVGSDQFGSFLDECLSRNGIDTSGLKRSDTVNTTLAFVHLSETGDRSFSFYRNPGADMMLEESDIDWKMVADSRIFHFGSISMTDEPARSATFKALKVARESGAIVSYDPNLRPPLWRSLDEAKTRIKEGLNHSDILKISEEELEFITGEKDLVKGTGLLAEKGPGFIMVTLGPKGAFCRLGDTTGKFNTYETKVVDTTGCGDAFLGGVLYRLKDMQLSEIRKLSKSSIEEIIDFGNAVGALTATKKGAIPALPSMEQVRHCIRHVPKLIP